MARNSEKAQSMLFRFRAAQAADLGILDISRTRRPKLITSITSIPACEKWRGQVLKEISRKVTKIQDPALSDFQIRDLNDEINKLMREKHMWEVQIRGLGGRISRGGRVVDEEGREVPGVEGGIELFEAAKPSQQAPTESQTRAQLSRNIDASYYGYNLDEEDGTLLEYEAQREKEAFEKLMAEPDEVDAAVSPTKRRKGGGR
ncbi:NineTeen Complex (NTC) component [Coniosporium tulheliwenetii]|uniref:NineTeen Complex (NTC) component n=1 Tax=Coniosporium tulheliwenetii TaxID=3383036 RepID=A0ACC2YVQ6_9PEZI|nr:NineTeen Complex (NTC) component [Cladosporium sp. JES 115]